MFLEELKYGFKLKKSSKLMTYNMEIFSDDDDGENVMKKILMGKTKKVNI